MFGLNDVSGRVWFGSGRFRVNQFLIKYARNVKTSNFVENFGSGMVRVGSGQFGFRVRFRVSIFRVSGRVCSGSFGSGFGSHVNFARSNYLLIFCLHLPLS